ncbi:MAG: septal ring lytic transglycosylase RlpA family protein [Pseudomonadales bacterium]|nr:septal ring lytic transglycosylase RlpA family protein [Pseudomonadales bacterium]
MLKNGSRFTTTTLLMVITGIILGGCSHRTPFEAKDGPPKLRKDISAVQNATPKHEPRARYGNHTPYKVFGKTYHVLNSSDGYREDGVASWYGEKFAGRSTSSMEPYDPYAMTAAHKSLPLPTYVKVTNLENNRSVIVRVNDRGPFHGNRIIDLSYAAAIKLGYANKGTAAVRVEAIDPSQAVAVSHQPEHSPAPPVDENANTDKATAKPQNNIYLQAGAFSNLASATRLKNQLKVVLNSDIHIQPENNAGKVIHRVFVGPFKDEINALAAQAVIRDTELANPLLVKRDFYQTESDLPGHHNSGTWNN